MEIKAALAEAFYDYGSQANTDEWWYEKQQSLGNGHRHAEYLLVLEHRASGERYGVSFGIGLDKHQDNSLPWDSPWISGQDIIAMEGPLVAKVITETQWELPGGS